MLAATITVFRSEIEVVFAVKVTDNLDELDVSTINGDGSGVAVNVLVVDSIGEETTG